MKSNYLKEKKFCQQMTLMCLKKFTKTQNELFKERARDFYKLVLIWDKKLKDVDSPLIS